MALTYKDLQDEVKRRATREQGGSQFDEATKNAINSSLFRICREAYWRQLRREDVIRTKTSYTTGSGSVSVTSDNTTVNVTGATFITDDVQVGRRVKLSSDSRYFFIRQITGETSFVMDYAYGDTSHATATYEILPQDEYNLPIQCGHRMFLWHEDYGYPIQMQYVVDQDFFSSHGYRRFRHLTTKNIPVFYRMWGENMTIKSVLTPTTMSAFSSDSGDTTQDITVFGIANGYPDSETIRVNGASVVTGTTTFSSIDRIVKNASTDGRVTVTANGNTTNIYAVLPKGDITSGIMYKKIQVHPLPTRVFDLHVHYYKDPYRLVNDGDVHELGADFDEAIILLSVAKIKAETDQSEAGSFLGLYQDELKSLKKVNVDKIDYFPSLRSPNRGQADRFLPQVGYSQFGSQYGPSRRY